MVINGLYKSGGLSQRIEMRSTTRIWDLLFAVAVFLSSSQFHNKHSGERPYPPPLSSVGTIGAFCVYHSSNRANSLVDSAWRIPSFFPHGALLNVGHLQVLYIQRDDCKSLVIIYIEF